MQIQVIHIFMKNMFAMIRLAGENLVEMNLVKDLKFQNGKCLKLDTIDLYYYIYDL